MDPMAAMEPVLDIPAPEAGDTETVVSSLETAAIFGAKGDVAEALHWLRRAAESASDTGDDARTLTLAHSAATLSSRLHPSEPESARVPTRSPPPAEAAGEAEDATPYLLESPPHPPHPPLPTSRPSAAPTPPPPPSARLHLVAADAPSAAANSAMPSPPSARTTSPLKSVAPTARTSTAPRPSSLTPQAPKTSTGASTANGVRPASRSVTPSVLGAPPAAASTPKNPAPDPPADAVATPTGGRRTRQAARVSVTRSLTERGLYFVRVLDEGQAPPDDAFEALLVSNDVNQSLV
jgi:hypothetical protein